jgi:hypothetical protein
VVDYRGIRGTPNPLFLVWWIVFVDAFQRTRCS